VGTRRPGHVIRNMVGVTVGRYLTGFPLGLICRVNLICCQLFWQR